MTSPRPQLPTPLSKTLSQDQASSQKLFVHAFERQNQLLGLGMSGVGIDLLDTLVVNNVRCVIRVDGRRYQFHFCSEKWASAAEPEGVILCSRSFFLTASQPKQQI